MVEPEIHLPAMLANAHVEIADAVISTIMQSLPGFVQNLTKQTTAVQEAEREFFSTWPMLQKKEYQAMVADSIKAYRAVNPRAPREEVIRAAGLTALISLRLPIPPDLLVQPPAPTEPVALAGFTHAAPNAGGSLPVTPQSPNAFQLLNQEFDREDGS